MQSFFVAVFGILLQARFFFSRSELQLGVFFWQVFIARVECHLVIAIGHLVISRGKSSTFAELVITRNRIEFYQRHPRLDVLFGSIFRSHVRFGVSSLTKRDWIFIFFFISFGLAGIWCRLEFFFSS